MSAPNDGRHEHGRCSAPPSPRAGLVIGGTSPFGRRGHIRPALLGAVIASMIDGGLRLPSTSAAPRLVVGDTVPRAAVGLDPGTRPVATGRS
jgi:ABC-type xylose transport system permease subunit